PHVPRGPAAGPPRSPGARARLAARRRTRRLLRTAPSNASREEAERGSGPRPSGPGAGHALPREVPGGAQARRATGRDRDRCRDGPALAALSHTPWVVSVKRPVGGAAR